ncbi:hypothetical protein DINM_002498 [Dirofilaria immitis]|nr:hypothetical protein [Dirofilaria immitis]
MVIILALAFCIPAIKQIYETRWRIELITSSAVSSLISPRHTGNAINCKSERNRRRNLNVLSVLYMFPKYHKPFGTRRLYRNSDEAINDKIFECSNSTVHTTSTLSASSVLSLYQSAAAATATVATATVATATVATAAAAAAAAATAAAAGGGSSVAAVGGNAGDIDVVLVGDLCLYIELYKILLP